MREVLFRGKRTDISEWMYGNLVTLNGVVCIFDNGMSVEVNSETVGQWTGLLDKNGAKIFEGDIVGKDCWNRGVIDTLFEIVFRDGCFGMINYIDWLATDGETGIDEVYYAFYDNEREERFETERRVEVLGNMFDNPELMKR